jgi:WD40 repeat protein
VDTDKTVRVIKIETNQELASRKASAYLSALAFQDDPAELRIVESDVVRSWNYRTDKVRECAKVRGSNHEFSPDGKNLLHYCGCYKAFTPIVTDTTSWKSKKIGYTGNIRHVSLSPDATKLAIAADTTLVVWNLVENCALLRWKKRHYSDIRHAAFSADGQRIACVMNGGQAYLFDFRSGAKDSEIERPKPKPGELQCLGMVGPDDRMDRDGGHAAPLNPLPVACSVTLCKAPTCWAKRSNRRLTSPRRWRAIS